MKGIFFQIYDINENKNHLNNKHRAYYYITITIVKYAVFGYITTLM